MNDDVRLKIDIALAEYKTLRNEVLQRNTLLNQYLVATYVTLIAAIALIKDGFSVYWFVGAVIFALVLPFVVFRLLEYETLTLASRLQSIENYVNDLAGEKILIWEHRAGLLSVGYLDRFKYVLGRPWHDPFK
jgi:hypothetical protein